MNIHKKSKIALFVLSFIGLAAFGQTKSYTGSITKVSPFNDQYAVTVGDMAFILIVDRKDTTGTSFEINKEYKDLLVKREGKYQKREGKYEISSKYLNKKFKIDYTVNGKGWKCIKRIEPSDL